MTASAVAPFWSWMTADGLKWFRVGITSFLGVISVIGMGLADWHNDGYAWYLHNSYALTSVIGMICLSILSFYPSLSVL